VALRHLSEVPPCPSDLNKSVPLALDEVVLRSLAKEPHERYQTGAEFSAALVKAAADWQAVPAKKGRNVRRPSKVLISQKVMQTIAASPLPPLPPMPVGRQLDQALEQQSSKPYAGDARTVKHPFVKKVLLASTVLIVAALFSVGLIAIHHALHGKSQQ
jgi:hypothetical protein